jgi:hypothetical protein
LIAWIHGIKAIPTPAKEYELSPIPLNLENPIAAGGVIATILTCLVGIIIFIKNPSKTNSIILAGTTASPFVYTILFIVKGRGHDSTEFQKAQSALGFAYAGHYIDWIFAALTITVFMIWYFISKPTGKNIFTIIVGSILTFVFIVALQESNNAIFDPIFGQ